MCHSITMSGLLRLCARKNGEVFDLRRECIKGKKEVEIERGVFKVKRKEWVRLFEKMRDVMRL